MFSGAEIDKLEMRAWLYAGLFPAWLACWLINRLADRAEALAAEEEKYRHLFRVADNHQAPAPRATLAGLAGPSLQESLCQQPLLNSYLNAYPGIYSQIGGGRGGLFGLGTLF